jgi:hypothetical protein
MTTTTIIPQGHYLAIYDASKRPVAEKVHEACLCYQARFGQVPNVDFVNPAEVCAVEGVKVEARETIGKCNYWIGCEEARSVYQDNE